MRNLPYYTRRLQDIKQKVSVRNQYLSGNVRSSSIRSKFKLVLFLGGLAMYHFVFCPLGVLELLIKCIAFSF